MMSFSDQIRLILDLGLRAEPVSREMLIAAQSEGCHDRQMEVAEWMRRGWYEVMEGVDISGRKSISIPLVGQDQPNPLSAFVERRFQRPEQMDLYLGVVRRIGGVTLEEEVRNIVREHEDTAREDRTGFVPPARYTAIAWILSDMRISTDRSSGT